MVTDKSNERKYKRFSLKNAMIGFPGEENYWGEITNISRGGFKAFTNEDFQKGEILSVLIDLRRIPDQVLTPNHFEIKIKIMWNFPLTQKKGVKNTYGASFTDLGETEEELLNSLFESLDRSEKMSDEDMDNLLMEIDSYLEKFRK